MHPGYPDADDEPSLDPVGEGTIMVGLTKKRAFFCSAIAATMALGMSSAMAAATDSKPTTSGDVLTITISNPTDQQVYPIGANVDVVGRITLGNSSGGASVSYIIDTSGSTTDPVDPPCPGGATVLDCEKDGAKALNASIAGIPSGVQAGVIQFDSSSSVVQGFVAPSDPLVDTAIDSLTAGGGTDFDAALATNNTLFAGAPAGDRKIAYLLSDGQSTVSTGAGSPLALAVAAGIQVNTFSVGGGAAGCDPGSSLLEIATASGGTCTPVTDPTTLAAVLGDLKPPGIDRVELTFNGGTAVNVPLDALGNFKYTFTSGVKGGQNPIVADGFAVDGTAVKATVAVVGQAPTPPPAKPVPVNPRFTG